MCSSHRRLFVAFFLVGFASCRVSARSLDLHTTGAPDVDSVTVLDTTTSSYPEYVDYEDELNGTVVEINPLDFNLKPANGTWDIIDVKVISGAPLRKCPKNYKRVARKCKLDIKQCSAGEKIIEGQCQPDFKSSPEGRKVAEGQSQLDVKSCPEGQKVVAGKCQPDVKSCPEGLKVVDGKCQPIIVFKID